LLSILLIIVGAALILWAGNWGYLAWQKQQVRAIGGEIDAAEFEENMRKTQIIDLREKNEFDAGHILGARSLPYTQLRDRMAELRKDLPVYLYDTTGSLSVRAARRMQKAGFEKVSWLKKGYNEWSGKTKANKKIA